MKDLTLWALRPIGRPNRCINPECKAKKVRRINRGLCRTCYEAARDLVADYDVTWEYLEKLGLALPKLPGNWKNQSPFYLWARKIINRKKGAP